MEQMNVWGELYPTKKITKPIRLITLFSGIGAQEKALEVLGVPFENWHSCEWAAPSILAYNAIHIKDFTDYSKDLDKDALVRYLNGNISTDYNEPCDCTKKNEEWLRKVYNSCIANKNLMNIMNVKGKDLEIVDNDKFEYILTYSFPCVSKNTLVLSEKGYIPFRELKIGDKVLTKSNTWHKVVKQFDNGITDIYMLNAMGTAGIECTKEHKFYVREMYRKGHKAIRCFKEPIMKHAKDITAKDYLGIPIIKKEEPFYTNDLSFWYMLGMYLGDGLLSKTGYEIRFGFNKNKIKKFEKNINIKHTINQDLKNSYHLRFANKEIYEFIKKYIGTGSGNKKMPIEILNLPKPQLQAFYNGYLDTDGCIIGNKHQFSTINENLAYSIASIIHKLFHRPVGIHKVKVNPTKKIEGRIVHQKDWFLIRFKTTIDKQDKAFYENDYIWFPFKSLTYLRKDNVYNMEIEEDHSYIINGCVSANCQDLSLAGLRKGMAVSQKDGGTRSGLLWEVERILCECKELGSLPQVLLMENVPEVIGTGNIEHFNKWELKLEELGYSNFIKILNAKDYGIPQNRRRCFMVSILGNYAYNFPVEIDLKYKLKDLLEKSVDEKYYLSDKQISDIQNWNAYEKPLEKMEQVDKSQICPTFTTRSGAYAAGMTLVKESMPIKNATKQGYLEANEGDGVDISGRMETHRGTVQKGMAQTIKTSVDVGVVVKDTGERERESQSEYLGTFDYAQSNTLRPTIDKRYHKDSDISGAVLASGNQNGLVVKAYKEYGKVPDMFNPYNKQEIKDIAPTQLTNCGMTTCSSTVLIKEEKDDGNKKI